MSEASITAPLADASGEDEGYWPLPVWCDLSGHGRSKTYELIALGKLRAKKMGNSPKSPTLIERASGREYLASLPAFVSKLKPRDRSRNKAA